MTLRSVTAAALLGVFVAGGLPARADEVTHPAVGKALIAARNALAAGAYAKANAAVRQADAVPGKTAHEQSLIEQMRAAIASRSGDTAGAAAAYERLLNSGGVSGAEAQALMKNLALVYNTQKNFPQVAVWVNRYLKAGGTDPAMKTLEIQGYYRSGQYAQAAQLQQQQIAIETRAGRPPREEQLQLLYSCQLHMNDKPGELATIKQLVLYYPKPDYWLNIIDNVRAQPGFADRLLLDIYRLQFSLGLVNKPGDAIDYATLALQAKLPGEAKYVVDRSFQGGLLGTGPEASRHQRLKALVDKTYDATKAQLGKEDAEAATDRDGNRMLQLGETYVSYGDFAKGIPLMRNAIGKDQLRHPEDAKLELGVAYWQSGDKRDALATLRGVTGHDGTADVAALWMLRINTAK